LENDDNPLGFRTPYYFQTNPNDELYIYIGFGGIWTGEGLTANLLYKELTSVTYSFRQECVHVLKCRFNFGVLMAIQTAAGCNECGNFKGII